MMLLGLICRVLNHVVLLLGVPRPDAVVFGCYV